LGNSYNSQERCIAAGYDNGDLKIFDLRQNRLVQDLNLKNGVCGSQFDRQETPMNKLVVTCLEGVFHTFDLKTYHPTKGYSYSTQKSTDSTIWGVRHSPFNRDQFSILNGDGQVSVYSYQYPEHRATED
jgi:hypothetical protein